MPKRKQESVEFEDDDYPSKAEKVGETQKTISWRSPLIFSSPQVKFSPNLSFSKSSAIDSNSHNDTSNNMRETSPLPKNPKYLTVNFQCTPKSAKVTHISSQKSRGNIFPLSDKEYNDSPGIDEKENDIDKIDTFSDLCPSSIIDNISMIRNARINKKKMQEKKTSLMEYYSQFVPTNDPVKVPQRNELPDVKNQEKENGPDHHSYDIENSQMSDNLANLENSQDLFPTQPFQEYNDNVTHHNSFIASPMPPQHLYNQHQNPEYMDLDRNEMNVTMYNRNGTEYLNQSILGNNTMISNGMPFIPNSHNGISNSNYRMMSQMYQVDNSSHTRSHLDPGMPIRNLPVVQHHSLNSFPKIPSRDCSQYFQPIDPNNYAAKKPLLQNLQAPYNMSFNQQDDGGSEKFTNMSSSFYDGEIDATRIPMKVVNQNPTCRRIGNMSNYGYNRDSANERLFQNPTVFEDMNQSFYFRQTPHIPSRPSVSYNNQNMIFPPPQKFYVKDNLTGRLFEVPQMYQNMNQSYVPEEGLNMSRMIPVAMSQNGVRQQTCRPPFVAPYQPHVHNNDPCPHPICQKMLSDKNRSMKTIKLPTINDKEYVMNKFLDSLSETSFY